MTQKPVDLYDSHYGKAEAPVYAAVRRDAFGEDLGQASWITAAECDEDARRLGLAAGQRLLEVACGTGGVSTRFAERSGVSVVGIDLHAAAVAARSSIGFFVFTPPGVNEALLRAAGFRVVAAVDVTQGVATTSQRWHDARASHRRELLEIEGETRFEEFQRFLATVHALSSERRLSRYCYVGEKESRAS